MSSLYDNQNNITLITYVKTHIKHNVFNLKYNIYARQKHDSIDKDEAVNNNISLKGIMVKG
jgi:hypothetical protein